MAERIERARQLRKDATIAERKLWSILRNRRLGGYKFRRQVPIGPYFADFACIEAKLIIELDGSQHADQVAYDEARTRKLEGYGYRVVRFWNGSLLHEREGVVDAILRALQQNPSP